MDMEDGGLCSSIFVIDFFFITFKYQFSMIIAEERLGKTKLV